MKPIAAALAMIVAASAFAQGKANVPSEIRAIYAAQSADLKRGDWNAFFAYYDPNFVSIGSNGEKTDLAELRRTVLSIVKGSKKRSMAITYTGCKATAKQVDVSYVAITEIVPAKGAPLKLREVGTDTWKKTPHGWKETKTVDKFFGRVMG